MMTSRRGSKTSYFRTPDAGITVGRSGLKVAPQSGVRVSDVYGAPNGAVLKITWNGTQ